MTVGKAYAECVEQGVITTVISFAETTEDHFVAQMADMSFAETVN